MGRFFRKDVLVAISMSTNCQKLYSERRSNPVTDGKEFCCAKKPFKSHLTCGKFGKGYVNWPTTVYDPPPLHPIPFTPSPTPFTLPPSPYPLHPIPLHPTPFAPSFFTLSPFTLPLHPIPLHPTPFTLSPFTLPLHPNLSPLPPQH